MSTKQSEMAGDIAAGLAESAPASAVEGASAMAEANPDIAGDVAGGVAANVGIRRKLIKVSNENNFKPIFPYPKLCGDNAAMIAMVGLEKYKMKKFDNLDLPANPRLQLDVKAKFLKGAGVKI